MYNPTSSYRIQFSKSFTMNDLERHINYLEKIGAGSVYASPVFAAVSGSTHGYDVTNPLEIDPESGSLEDLARITAQLKKKGMGWIQDIVPNHMAFHHENRWLWDMLEKGKDSEFAGLFDTEDPVREGKEKILLPLLGNELVNTLKDLEIQICFYQGSLALTYYNGIYPASFDSFRDFFSSYIADAPDCFMLIWKRYNLENRAAEKIFLNGEWEAAKREIYGYCNSDPEMQAFINQLLVSINTDPSGLSDFINKQNYEPCHWKEASARINYRRFFTVNRLICLRMEDKTVYDKYHSLINRLVREGQINGLRVDHVDGLLNPADYLKELRKDAGEDTFIVVEKILEKEEQIPSDWPVQGNTGYDFLGMVNNLMIRKKDYSKLKKFYNRFTGNKIAPEEIIYNSKKLILSNNMRGELENIFNRLEPLLSYTVKRGIFKFDTRKGITGEAFKSSVAEFMLACPVYRLYPDEFPLNKKDRELAKEIFEIAVEREPKLKNALMLLQNILLKGPEKDDQYNLLLKSFFQRLMQFTGPLTAKGTEDTAMYRYNCFIGGNEVGDNLYNRGMDKEKFHEIMNKRHESYPLSMNCTSTHDTKRGEDVRARLNAIAELPDEWIRIVKKWEGLNRGLKQAPAPSADEEYFIYQTIAGTFPFDEHPGKEYSQRIKEYLVKALREAKVNSSWEDPDEKYEAAVCAFADAILEPGSKFIRSLLPFHRKIAWRGIVNSLTQLAIKCCSPGIPDIYRGTEVWDLSLVDPDNRTPVDFGSLSKNLNEINELWRMNPLETVRQLYRDAPDGRIKLLLTSILLNERKANPDLFLYGDYIPAETGGKYGSNIIGFVRKHKDSRLACILPLHSGYLSSKEDGEHFSSINWRDSHITLPEDINCTWQDIITGRTFDAGGEIPAGELFNGMPFAVLKATAVSSNRKAGILLHVSSLPSEYGTGDLGEEAYRFVDFLSRTYQAWWQTLPLSPVTKSQSWSPYSSPSAFAGNTLLVSPQQLYKDGLVSWSDLELVRFRNSSRVNNEKAELLRQLLFEKAWYRFRSDPGHYLYNKYEEFCRKESIWLDEYALFLAFKQKYRGKEWSRWPKKIKDRDLKTLKTAAYEYADIIMFEKFKQFIFFRQWNKLKDYANNKGIRILGDIPFYVSYDSADVWANQELFKLDNRGKSLSVAGVPSDYFDKNGQLWNMPVYNWDIMKKQGYDWWLRRLVKNLELYDLLRLDHFRAFSAYWEVPAGEKTAVNGKWTIGPGDDFFEAVNGVFPDMPFVAEDLGEIDQPVYDLKDKYGLPGMQVLQFSFGKDMPVNIHTPHNHKENSLVYTGTHDNNTTRGWYDRELDKDGRKRLNEYTGRKIKASELCRELIKMAYSSTARIAIIPIQDYWGLGREARMNTPSTSRGNWIWKIRNKNPYDQLAGYIRKLAVMYNRV